jgi:hypothetical protein
MGGAMRRVTVGFQGGQVLALKLTDEALKVFNEALGTAGWHQLDSEDGPVRVDLAQIVYVGADSDELRVGFG